MLSRDMQSQMALIETEDEIDIVENLPPLLHVILR